MSAPNLGAFDCGDRSAAWEPNLRPTETLETRAFECPAVELAAPFQLCPVLNATRITVAQPPGTCERGPSCQKENLASDPRSLRKRPSDHPDRFAMAKAAGSGLVVGTSFPFVRTTLEVLIIGPDASVGRSAGNRPPDRRYEGGTATCRRCGNQLAEATGCQRSFAVDTPPR